MAGSSSGSQDSEGEIYKIIGHGGGQRRDRGDTGVRELGTFRVTPPWSGYTHYQVTSDVILYLRCLRFSASQVFSDDLLVF